MNKANLYWISFSFSLKDKYTTYSQEEFSSILYCYQGCVIVFCTKNTLIIQLDVRVENIHSLQVLQSSAKWDSVWEVTLDFNSLIVNIVCISSNAVDETVAHSVVTTQTLINKPSSSSSPFLLLFLWCLHSWEAPWFLIIFMAWCSFGVW